METSDPLDIPELKRKCAMCGMPMLVAKFFIASPEPGFGVCGDCLDLGAALMPGGVVDQMEEKYTALVDAITKHRNGGGDQALYETLEKVHAGANSTEAVPEVREVASGDDESEAGG